MSRAPLVRLGDCCEIVSGATPSTSVDDYWDGEIAWATPKDLSDLDSKYISATPQTLTDAGYGSCSAKVMPAGSVLFSSRAPIGHVAINTVPMCTNQGFKSFVPDPERVSADYLYHWLKANKAYLQSLGNGATFKELSKAVVAEVRIPLPPLVEQRRIAAILDKADALRTNRRQAITKLDQLQQAFFLSVLGDVAQWPTTVLSEVCEAGSPITYGILQPGPDIEDGVPYVRPSEIKDGRIVVESLRRTSAAIAKKYAKSSLRGGDILVTIVGTIGAIAVVPKELHGANITQSSARVRVCPSKAQRRFVELFLRSPFAKEQYERARLGVAVERLNLHHVRDLQMPLPPMKVQEHIARGAEKIESLKAKHALSLSEIHVLTACLLNRAFGASTTP